MAETIKSKARRDRENWFETYAPNTGKIIDIGAGNDPLYPDVVKYDFIHGSGDAQYMKDIKDATFDTVYSSHLLEHVHEPLIALKNWWRILKPGGNLIVCVPHRDLYEKRTRLPSNWNGDHKTYWLPDHSEPPCTFSVRDTFNQAIPDGRILVLRVLDENYLQNGTQHSGGEYSIEIIVHKTL